MMTARTSMSGFGVERLSAFGAVMEITFPGGAASAHWLGGLPACWQPAPDAQPDMRFSIEPQNDGPDGEPRFLFRQDGAQVAGARTCAQVRDILAARMDYFLGAHARDCAFVHAALVLKDGQGLLFPGRSHAGKSTLAAALAAAGADYVSDDVAVIDRAGRVHFLGRPLTLRDDMIREEMAKAVPPPANGGPAGFRMGTAPVGAILFLTYAAGARELELFSLSRGEAVQGLMANSMNGRRHPELALHCCTAAASLALCGHGVRGEAGQAARSILASVSCQGEACVGSLA